jgi:ATP-dependent RNA helicase DDX49/DBP8
VIPENFAMSKDHSARKRRRVEATGTTSATEPTTGAVVFDDEAMKRHMISLLQQSANSSKTDLKPEADQSEQDIAEDGEESEEESEDEDDGNSQDVLDHSEMIGKRGQEVSLSDDEDQDEVAETLLQGRKPVNAAADITSTSRISRVPANRSATSAPKKPVLKTTFEGLGLSPQLIRTLAGISIKKPTEIQSACFEHILKGREICDLMST